MKNLLLVSSVLFVSLLSFGTLNAQAVTFEIDETISASVDVKAVAPIREFCGDDKDDEDKDE